jgi:hypothetical protein
VSEHLDELLRYVGFDEADGARPDFSAHADYAELLDWLRAGRLAPRASLARPALRTARTARMRAGPANVVRERARTSWYVTAARGSAIASSTS